MCKKLKSIGLGFENCEYLDIPAEYIDDYAINKIYRDIFPDFEFDCCESFSLTIRADANKVNWRPSNPKWWSDRLSLFERLTYRDLVSTTLTYEDGSQREIFLPWDEDIEAMNTYHHMTLTPLCQHAVVAVGPDDFVRRRMDLAEKRDEYDHSCG